MSLAFFSAVPARDLSCHHTCAHALDTTTETTTTITPNSKSGSRSQWSRPTQRAVTPKQLPQAHCARAITGTKPTRHSDGRGRGGAAHGGDGGDRRSHGGAVARAMWQRRVTGRLQTITTARNDRAKARYFNSLLLGYAGGGGSERRWQGPRAHAALWSAVAAVVLAAATCSPSGGGGSGRCLCRCRCNRSNRALNWSSGQRDRSGDRAGCCARRPSGRVRSPQREEEGERR